MPRRSKFSDAQQADIVNRYFNDGWTQVELADEYKVHQSTINRLVAKHKTLKRNLERARQRSAGTLADVFDDEGVTMKDKAHIAIKTLEGTGDFKSKEQQININFQQAVAGLPLELIAKTAPHQILGKEGVPDEIMAIAEAAEEEERQRLKMLQRTTGSIHGNDT